MPACRLAGTRYSCSVSNLYRFGTPKTFLIVEVVHCAQLNISESQVSNIYHKMTNASAAPWMVLLDHGDFPRRLQRTFRRKFIFIQPNFCGFNVGN